MLNSIRNAASNWLGRVVLVFVMGLLIVSFAIWGIGDIFRGGTSRNVASVGKATITADQFRSNFLDELRRLQQRTRRAITTDEAKAFGLHTALLNRMIDETALGQKAARLGLALQPEAVARSVIEADIFKTNGVFDRNRFADMLQTSGLSEQAFLKLQGELLLRQQLYVGLMGGLEAPQALAGALHQYQNEIRDVSFLLLPPSAVAAPGAPDEAALKAFHEERRAEFRTTESRKVTVLATSSSAYAGEVTVTEADLRAFYDRQVATGRFGAPEKRRASRVLFDTEAEAKAAKERLAGGLAFDALLAEKKLAAKDVDLGLKSRAELTDPAVAGAVFGLEVGQVSDPVKDPFGFVLLRVEAVEPSKALAFDAVKATIQPDVRLEKIARDPSIKAKLDAAYRQVEDQRIAGKSLNEAAKAAGLVAVEIPVLTRQGTDENGQRISLAGGAETLQAIYASDIGLDNEPLPQRDGGHVWFEVNAVEPARDKAFEDVKDEVRTRFLADAQSRALSDLATELAKKIEGGATLDAVAAELKLTPEAATGLKRGAREQKLGTAALERAFAGPVGKPVHAASVDGVSRLLMVPVAAKLAEAGADAAALRQQLANGLQEDAMLAYTAAVRKEIGVSINQTVLNQALGQTN